MEFDASWSLDSESDGLEKMESGINGRAIDFAKIGRLVLNRGNWNGEQVISAGWIEESTRIDPANAVPDLGDDLYYQRGWWIHGPSAHRYHAIAAWGHLGQYIYVFPEEKIVIVRFGSRLGDVSWAGVFQAIVDAVS